MSGANWCTIESDPGVFTDLIEEFGVSGLEVNECFSLDDLHSFDQKVHGVIFLFKWQPEEDNRPVADWRDANVFFAKQIINNACATQAILSILLNAQIEEQQLGNTLTDFKKFAWSLDPESRGEAINNSEDLRKAHNSFSQQTAFSMEDMGGKDDEDVFHFISYVPCAGRLYELDGLKQGPIDLGECNDADWKIKASAAIQERTQRYSGEIRFSLLSVVDSPLPALHKKLATLEAETPIDTAGINQVKQDIAAQEDRRKKWREENIRRKHNYIPFVLQLLRVLAEKGELSSLVSRAKDEEEAASKKRKAPEK